MMANTRGVDVAGEVSTFQGIVDEPPPVVVEMSSAVQGRRILISSLRGPMPPSPRHHKIQGLVFARTGVKNLFVDETGICLVHGVALPVGRFTVVFRDAVDATPLALPMPEPGDIAIRPLAA